MSRRSTPLTDHLSSCPLSTSLRKIRIISRCNTRKQSRINCHLRFSRYDYVPRVTHYSILWPNYVGTIGTTIDKHSIFKQHSITRENIYRIKIKIAERSNATRAKYAQQPPSCSRRFVLTNAKNLFLSRPIHTTIIDDSISDGFSTSLKSKRNLAGKIGRVCF